MKEFLKRGLVAAWGGPFILAIIYGILGVTGAVETLTPYEVCTGVISVTLMAFIAAGVTAVYQSERLPLPSAILIHAGVLYLDYLVMYLFNSWIPRNRTAIGVFSVIFAAGFALVWLIIYCVERKRIVGLNKKLKK